MKKVVNCSIFVAVSVHNENSLQKRRQANTKVQLEHAVSLLEQGHSYKEVAAITGISKSTLIRKRKLSL